MDPKHLTLLRIHDACQGLSVDEIETIAAKTEVVQLAAGKPVHSAGQPIDAVYIVVEGRLEMIARSPDGRQRTIRYISAGDQFGALMLVSEEEIPVEVVVDETATLFRLPKEFAEQLADEFPIFRRNLLHKIGTGVRDSMHWRRKRTMSKIVTFVYSDDQSESLVTDIAARLDEAGETIGILSDSRARIGVPTWFTVRIATQSGGWLYRRKRNTCRDQAMA